MRIPRALFCSPNVKRKYLVLAEYRLGRKSFTWSELSCRWVCSWRRSRLRSSGSTIPRELALHISCVELRNTNRSTHSHQGQIPYFSQPNIVLSKLRVADLPAEHKRARLLDDQQAVCEDRSICELIVAGGEPESNILQNALWNLATRWSIDTSLMIF